MSLTYVHACEHARWHLEIWRREDPGHSRRRVVYRCGSWRHEGWCRLRCGACDFVRIQSAIKQYRQWTYLVLTYPREKGVSQRDLFRRGVHNWYSLRKRIEAKFGKVRYIQTWEIQRDGTPHCNVIMNCSRFFSALRDDHRRVKVEWLEPAVVASGFGGICYCEAMRSATRMAGYLTKLAKELTGAGVKCQVPINAPRHFRRIRASIGLLPPRRKDPELTGRLIRNKIPASPCPGLLTSYGLE